MYKKAYNLIIFIIFMLCVNISAVHGMDKHTYENLKSGDFSLFLDDMAQYMMGYLYIPLPVDCKAEYFNNQVFRNVLYEVSHSNQQDLQALGITCKRLWVLSKKCIDRNKDILNNLIFELLRPTKHTDRTEFNIGLCITAGANINYCNEWNETPLVYAISSPSCHKFIDVLIKEGAQVDQVGALEKAEHCKRLYCGHLKNKAEYFKELNYDYDIIIKLLVEHGAKPTGYEDDDSESDDACQSLPSEKDRVDVPEFLAHSASSDDDCLCSSESDEVAESFYADSTSSEDDFLSPPASDPLPNLPTFEPPVENALPNPPIDKPPVAKEPFVNNTVPNRDSDTFFTRISAHRAKTALD